MDPPFKKQLDKLHPYSPLRLQSPWRDQDHPFRKNVQFSPQEIVIEPSPIELQFPTKKLVKKRKPRSIFQTVNFDREQANDVKLICKAAMNSPEKALNTISSKPLLQIHNQQEKFRKDAERDPEKYQGKKPIEMPPIFDREVSFLDKFKQRRGTVSHVISRQNLLPKIEEIQAGTNCFVSPLDVMDLMQNLNDKSQLKLNKRYPQLSPKMSSHFLQKSAMNLYQKSPGAQSRNQDIIRQGKTTFVNKFDHDDRSIQQANEITGFEEYDSAEVNVMNSGFLPQLQSSVASVKKGKSQKNPTYVMSLQTQKEFNLKAKDIPVYMRPDAQSEFRNHIYQNVQLAEKYNDVNKIVFLSKLKFNIETEIQNREKVEEKFEKERVFYERKLSKWDDFRQRRYLIIQQYLAAKRKQRMSEQIIRLVGLIQCVRQSSTLLTTYYDYRALQSAISFLQIKFYCKFKVLLLKNRGLTERYRQQIRSVFALSGQVLGNIGQQESEAKFIIAQMLEKTDNSNQLYDKLSNYKNRILYIQNKIKDYVNQKKSKLIVFKKQWENNLAWVEKQAGKLKSKKLLDICILIKKIPEEIQNYILKKYLERNQFLTWIKFYKTRLVEKSDVCDEGEIKLQIFKLLNFMADQVSRCKKIDLILPETVKQAYLSRKEIEEMDFPPSPPAQIITFQQIAWYDPWKGIYVPQENTKKLKKAVASQEVKHEYYDPDVIMEYVEKSCRFYSLAMPSKQFMFQMMRACINIEQEKDVFIYEQTKISYNGATNSLEQIQKRATLRKKQK